jgi:hypothetical protein
MDVSLHQRKTTILSSRLALVMCASLTFFEEENKVIICETLLISLWVHIITVPYGDQHVSGTEAAIHNWIDADSTNWPKVLVVFP